MRPRTGSVYFNPRRNRWVGAVSLGGGRRRAVSAPTEAEAWVKLATLDPSVVVGHGSRNPAAFRSKRESAILAHLCRARDRGWDDEMTARVMAAGLTTARIRAGVVGPCVYCGDEFASTVDHVIALANGGSDLPENVVSACVPCNARKGKN